MAKNGISGVLTMNSIFRRPIQDYIGLLTLTIVKNNARSANIVQYNKDKHTNRVGLYKQMKLEASSFFSPSGTWEQMSFLE